MSPGLLDPSPKFGTAKAIVGRYEGRASTFSSTLLGSIFRAGGRNYSRILDQGSNLAVELVLDLLNLPVQSFSAPEEK